MGEIQLYTLVSGLGTIVGIAVAAWLGSVTGRRSAQDLYRDLEVSIEKERSLTRSLRDEASDFFERGASQRNRSRAAQQAAEKARDGPGQGAPAAGLPANLEAYRVHLETGGALIPEMESQLG